MTPLLTDPDGMIAVLAASHTRLDALTADLGELDLAIPTALPDWPVAQVLSHLGSGAEIGAALVRRGLDGAPDPLDGTAMAAVWDRWKARTPAEQQAERREQDTAHLALLTGLTAAQRATLRIPYFVGPLTVAEYAGYRLSEHAVHTFDLAAALDPDARIDAAAVPALWARLPLIAGRFHDADARSALAPARIALVPTDGLPAQVLTVDADGVTLAPGTADARVAGPAEALVRLVYGRLDPDVRADDRLTGAGGGDPAALRTLFRGY